MGRGIWTRLAAALSAAAVLTAGCAGAEAPPEDVTLKVWSWDGNFNEYAADYMAQHPHVKLVRVPPYDETAGFGFDDAYYANYLQAAEAAQPDVLMVPAREFVRLAEAGKLRSLESFVARPEFEASTYSPHVLSLLRASGDGELFGVSQGFYNQALYYNKTLFESYGVTMPQAGLSWDAVLELAASFPAGEGESGVAGYFVGKHDTLRPWRLIETIGLAAGLEYADGENRSFLVDSDAWASVWSKVLEGYASGTVLELAGERELNALGDPMPFGPEEQYGPFLEGRAAMTLQDAAFTGILTERAVPFEWGVVSEPVDPALAEGVSMQPGHPYAIFHTSAQVEEAWRLIAFLTKRAIGERISAFGALTARTNAASAADPAYAPFYEPEPSAHGAYKQLIRRDVPDAALGRFLELADERFADTLEGRLTVEEALSRLAEEATAAWRSLPAEGGAP